MAPKFDVYAHVTDTIIAEIEAGTPPWRKPWTGSASGIALPTRHNGEEYRGINVLMLWIMAARRPERAALACIFMGSAICPMAGRSIVPI
ncbi:ArdC family protein [Sulfitobacter mediterraneus]|uniref:ArdC family protein n=1 Tax=Sulfitobacter mediterraneus TaxID=83219 RepID=UPI0024914918|nr:ArdC family protein [Sulfitobacter mediterraneus]